MDTEKWDYRKYDVNDKYSQNAWNQTLISKLNEIKGSLLSNDDIISASYVLKNLLETLMWLKLSKPIINYRYDNEHSLYFNNVKLRIENYPFNHQLNEEWIESQKNIFLNLDTNPIDDMYPEIWKSRENVRNYLNNKFSSNRIIENNDVVYSGILHNFIENENNLVFFHIDEIKNISKNIYVYYNNETNKSLLPHLTLKTT